MFIDCSVHHGHREIWIFVAVTGKQVFDILGILELNYDAKH